MRGTLPQVVLGNSLVRPAARRRAAVDIAAEDRAAARRHEWQRGRALFVRRIRGAAGPRPAASPRATAWPRAPANRTAPREARLSAGAYWPSIIRKMPAAMTVPMTPARFGPMANISR